MSYLRVKNMLLEVGRVCIKTVGHEANKACVVLDSSGNNFVVVAGPGVKKRRCNISHLKLLPQKLDIKKGADVKEAIDALLKAGVVLKTDLPNKPEGYTPKARGGERKPTAAKAETPKKPEKAVAKQKK